VSQRPTERTIVKTQLPYKRIVESHDDLSKTKLDDVMHKALASSVERPCYLELHDNTQQRFLFIRDGQIYAAGLLQNNQFTNSAIRDFILAVGTMNFPQLVWYELNNKLLHSILILFQKKAVQRMQTSLVDLDELLDKIEADGKSCIVGAVRENFLAILRYEKGEATALCHEESSDEPREASFREEFLVNIYTITTELPVTIGLYEDLLVTYAPDAKTIPDSFEGRLEELYLSKPPMVSLRFKDKEIDHWVFDKPRLQIGRTPDNDIVIDNLAVSRLHAVLEEEKGYYYVRDHDSLNGTVVNGQKIGRARLEDGDEVSIGKHTIVFLRRGGQAVPAGETIEGFDQTMIINRDAPPTLVSEASCARPRLVVKTPFGDRVVEIKDTVTIGKDVGADIAIEGTFVARRHAEVVRDGDKILIRHLGGLRKVTVGGKSVREIELNDNDEIKIAKEEFVFHE
jgi:pSer/pThr/pTyr-binding forkhead associated (FHA) protein